jgi:hypothetical protein
VGEVLIFTTNKEVGEKPNPWRRRLPLGLVGSQLGWLQQKVGLFDLKQLIS